MLPSNKRSHSKWTMKECFCPVGGWRGDWETYLLKWLVEATGCDRQTVTWTILFPVLSWMTPPSIFCLLHVSPLIWRFWWNYLLNDTPLLWHIPWSKMASIIVDKKKCDNIPTELLCWPCASPVRQTLSLSLLSDPVQRQVFNDPWVTVMVLSLDCTIPTLVLLEL